MLDKTEPQKRARGVPTVVVDLDGVLAVYDGWEGIDFIGEPIKGAIGFIQDLLSKGFKVLVSTTRTNTEANTSIGSGQDHLVGERWRKHLVNIVSFWLSRNGFPAQNDMFSVYAGPGKPIAIAYIDDRAVMCRPRMVESLASLGGGKNDEYKRAISQCLLLAADGTWHTEKKS